MRTHIYRLATAVLLLCGVHASAQPEGTNYVTTKIYLNETSTQHVLIGEPEPVDTSRFITSVQYFDGIGRPTQLAENGSGTNGLFNHSITEYDLGGRGWKQYLPVRGGSMADPMTAQSYSASAQVTYGDTYSFSETGYDAFDRVTSVLGPGRAWHTSHAKSCRSYRTNANISVKKYIVTSTGAVVCRGYHSAGKLTVERVTDEDDNYVDTYRDILGNVVMESQSDLSYTYYVYDSYNRLRYVLQPMYQQNPDIGKFAFKYEYDDKGRCVKKTLPGCEHIQYWYDRYNRLAFMQDGNMRDEGVYRFYLYEPMGRLAVQGVCTNVNGNATYNAAVSYSASAGVDSTGYMMASSYDMGDVVLELANYYDNYLFLDHNRCGDASQWLKKTALCSAMGMQTGSAVMNTKGDKEGMAYYYDEKGRITDRRRTFLGTNHLQETTEYSFTGNPTRKTKTLGRNGSTYSLDYAYSYYPANDRLHTVSLSYNQSTPTTIAEYFYNDLGQVERLEQGDGATYMDYEYNIRGSLTDIDGDNLKMHYTYTDGFDMCHFNGYISTLSWLKPGTTNMVGYTFSYDELNRLYQADFFEHGGQDYTDTYCFMADYDLNGNFAWLRCYGLMDDDSYSLIDDLEFTYDGNQLTKADNTEFQPNYTGSFHFMDDSDDDVEYEYDKNGNLTKDNNKNILGIQYNSLNLPSHIQYVRNSMWNISKSYTYDMTGTKLSDHYTLIHLHKVVTSRYYLGDFQFGKNGLERIILDGGYMTFSGNDPVFHYYQCDHLGSVRSVVDEDGNLEYFNEYYPFCATYSLEANSEQAYKFNAKELDRTRGLNLYDYGARWYDPILGRFTTMDPMCEKYYSISPYAYCADNPVNAVDTDGMAIIFFKDNAYYKYSHGFFGKCKS